MKEGNVIREYIMDAKTGEITGEIREGDRILRKGSIEYLNNTEEWKIEHFFKGNINEINKWLDDLSTHESAFLFRIVSYISYDDCHLQHLNGRDVDTEDLIKIARMKKRTAYGVIESLIKKDILYRGKNSKNRQYFINPWLFCKGHRINKVLRTMFQNYKIRVCDGTPWKEL